MTFTTEETYDICVSCGQQTSYKKTDNIHLRFIRINDYENITTGE